MENDWIFHLLSDKVGHREVAIKGVKGQDKKLEQLISQRLGQSNISYYTTRKDKVNNKDTFLFSKFGENKEKHYLVISSAGKYNEAEGRMFEKWGCREFEDFLWLNHAPINAADMVENDEFSLGGVWQQGCYSLRRCKN